MGEEVVATGDTGGIAILEAGTGTGKTFAYLAPLLLSAARVVVSTSTRGLQEQLCNKDIPALKKALGVDADIRLLKGRRNYVCKRRLAENLEQPELSLDSRDRRGFGWLRKDLAAVAKFAQDSVDGDLAMLTGVPTQSRVWPLVTSTVDNCSAARCPDYSSCFVYKARRRARDAQLLIVNHSLLLSDAHLRERGMGEIIPPYDFLVCDEAHVLPEMILKHFSLICGTEETVRRTGELLEAAAVAGFPAHDEYTRALGEVRGAAAALRGSCERSWLGVVGAEQMQCCTEFCAAAKLLRNAFCALEEQCLELTSGDDGFSACADWAAERKGIFAELLAQSGTAACWIEVGKRAVVARMTPFNTDEIFRRTVLDERKVVFTSATLAVDGSFDLFRRRLGITHAREKIWGSPFDYAANTRLLLPDGMPDPRDDRAKFVEKVCETVTKLALANRGRAFALFAAYSDMKQAGELLADSLAGKCKVLVQGDQPPDLLLRKFRARGHEAKILVGTRTFWQGVDIPGQSLSLVVVDRIPFQPPDDPLLEVLAAALDDPGKVFSMIQVPSAALLLKQAAGRLIRGENDRGVLVICDPRLRNMAYGKAIMRSLPPMPEAGSASEAEQFLRAAKPVG